MVHKECRSRAHLNPDYDNCISSNFSNYIKAGSKANTKNEMAGVIAFECLSIAGSIYSFWYIEIGPKSPFIFPNNI